MQPRMWCKRDRASSSGYTRRVVIVGRVLRIVVLAAALLSSPTLVRAGEPVAFRISVEHAGIYEVTYAGLLRAGLEGTLASAHLGLSNRGESVSMWIEDGGDGEFGPGDRFFFVGEILRGSYSYFDPYSRTNCYVLRSNAVAPWHGTTVEVDGAGTDVRADSSVAVAHHHLEADTVMVRYRATREKPEESWYWARLSVTDREPFRQTLSVAGIRRLRPSAGATSATAETLADVLRGGEAEGGGGPGRIRSNLMGVFGEDVGRPTSVRVTFGFRGWSLPRHREAATLPHHEVEIRLGDTLLDTVAWDGNEHFVHTVAVDSTAFARDEQEVSLRVPKRYYPDSGDLVVDVVLLNWIEIEYEHEGVLHGEQLRLRPAGDELKRSITLRSADRRPVELYLKDGRRLRGPSGVVTVEVPDEIDELAAAPAGHGAPPVSLVLDRPSDLKSSENQADYIMITHASLAAGAARLASFHRSRGLSVVVVDVQDIYDEFNHGILDPEAIKRFLEFAHGNWRSPAPRFVLLVGDASWDFKNATADDANYADWTYRPGEARQFVKNRSTAYADHPELNQRNLVPTSSYPTLEGHAASDTWFVCFDDGDLLPDMAIGRIPVVTLDELDGVVDKTISFVSNPPLGPWRRNLLFIANESVGFQNRSDRIAEVYAERGYATTKIYPHPSEPANEHHTRKIVDSMNGGVLAVHFIGHGGRYIWRTGPPDLEKNHDLFTLDHVDSLADNDRLAVIVSLTCYSAPFDHPTADSIGEKLLRIPNRGAIAVFAASWRNSPSPVMGELLLAELTTPGNTIGEAVMRAKRGFRSQVLVQTYNLLGDPAVPVSPPAVELDLALERIDDGLELRVAMPTARGSYEMIAEWVGGGDVLRSDRLTVDGSEARVAVGPGEPADDTQLDGVRVYVWDDGAGVDGVGWAKAPGNGE